MMRATLVLSAALLSSTSACYAAKGSPLAYSMPPPYINAAVADKARPEADSKRDADRHPAMCLNFAGLKPGETVLELAPGGGYYTRLLSAVVGAKGKVYPVVQPRKADAPADAPEPGARLKPITSDAHYANVSLLVTKYAQPDFPQGLDLVWTSLNYHDFHNIPELNVADLNKAVFKALKPGGILLVIDHAAEPGSGLRDTATLHRIDEAAVKKELMAAGFEYAGKSDILRNKDDPRTGKVFDPPIQGHTDQFILKFRKPKK